MEVLVCYASAHGSTKGIARAIGDRLTELGLPATVLPVDEVDHPERYGAVVLGSAIHNNRWLPAADAFVAANTAELATRPVWLFSVSSLGDTSGAFGTGVSRFMRARRTEPNDVTAHRKALGARGHRSFAGEIERDHWGMIGHVFLKAFGGRYGDHRDWADIDAWAEAIARELGAEVRSPTPGGDGPTSGSSP